MAITSLVSMKQFLKSIRIHHFSEWESLMVHRWLMDVGLLIRTTHSVELVVIYPILQVMMSGLDFHSLQTNMWKRMVGTLTMLE